MSDNKSCLIIEKNMDSIIWILIVSLLCSIITLLFIFIDPINAKYNESIMNNHYYHGGNGLELYETILLQNMY